MIKFRKQNYIHMHPGNDIIHEISQIAGLPIFFKPWWLQIASEGKDWEYVVSRDKAGIINGLIPMIYENKLGMTMFRMVPLTPFLGPWIKPFDGHKMHAKISYEQKIMENLIKGLPSFSYYCHKFAPNINNWYPFYKHGFDQTTHYTFILNNINQHELIWQGLKNTVRTEIRNSETGLKIIEKNDPDLLYKLQENSFQVPYRSKLLKEIVRNVYENNSGEILFAVTDEGEIQAGLLLVWDDDMAYMPVLGMNNQLIHKGSVQYLIWESIKRVSEKVASFNFEGTMLPNVEPVFRHFGGYKHPYYIVSKDKNLLLKLIRIATGR